MKTPNDLDRGSSGRGRTVPVSHYNQEIIELKQRVKKLENKVDGLQELVDQYEWAIGIGDQNARC